MQTIELKFKDKDYEDEVMLHLRGQVFHMTTEKAFKNIIKTSYIYNNKNGRFPLNTSSEKSFGRNNGWVCLFDFRMKSDAVIHKTKSCYYFLGPSWFWTDFKRHQKYLTQKLSIAYLILNPSYYNKLVPNSAASRSCGQYIPDTECWFHGDISIAYIDKVVMLKAYRSISGISFVIHQSCQPVDKSVSTRRANHSKNK